MSNRVKAAIRLLVTLVSVVNMFLTAKGINPIPFDEALVAEVAVYIETGIMAIWTWWKDAPMTKEANEKHDEMVLEKQTAKGKVAENFFDTAEEVE